MRASHLLIATLKEVPADAELISHQLMLRAGMIRKLEAGGLYAWLPMGLRVLRKVEAIVRQEMDRAGAQELLMPVVQPADLWHESGRWAAYGPELLRFHDRHAREFCLGPTHEEVITDIARRELRSYKQLPVNFYQIQTKFRDEIRPRFGVMRAREFLMKDAYSFHIDQSSLEGTYQAMFEAYHRIFQRIGLACRAVQADTGSIGGNRSHEFHVLADAGEDAIAYSTGSDYAANVELAATVPTLTRPAPSSPSLAAVNTPKQRSIEEVADFLSVTPQQCLKTLIVRGREAGKLVALVLRGDHSLNEIKAAKQPAVDSPLTFATEEEIRSVVGCTVGSIGPVGLNMLVISDYAAAAVADFVCGANQDDQHLVGVNWARDLPEPQTADLRNVVDGDVSPDGAGVLKVTRGIEVGHIFQLGDKYSAAMNARVLDEGGRSVAMMMGCYGIGVSRVVAATIEQHHDAHGIIWPEAIAPFQLALLPMNMHKSERLRGAATQLYETLVAAGIEVIFDDRGERPGVMFADMELIGIPHRLVISDRGLDEGTLEYKGRRDPESQKVPAAEIIAFLQACLGHY